MVASTRVQALTQGMEFVSILEQFIRDPGLVTDLAVEVEKLNKLTDEQSAQLHEATMLMQQRDNLKKEISALNKEHADTLKANAAEAEKLKQELSDYVAVQNAVIEKKHADLDKRQAELDDYSLRLDQRENALKEKAAVVNGLFGG